MDKFRTFAKIIFEKSNVAVFCILAMTIGFLTSPAMCSIGVIVFGFNGIRDVNPKRWFRQTWWLLGALWIACYAVTWFWSADKGYWSTRLQVKLPFLILPLAFAFLPRFSVRQLQILTVGMGAILLAGVAYSLSFLVNDYEYYMIEYKYSHLLPTPVRGDHIRFSLSIAFYLVWCTTVWPAFGKPWLKALTAGFAATLFVYLHILSAKSGLLAVYLFLMLWCFYMLFTKKRIYGILVSAGLVVGIVLCAKLIPTFSERMEYIKVTWIALKSGDRTGTYGDLGRLISYDIAVKLIGQNPIKGTGVGNMQAAMKTGYDAWFPLVPEDNRLLPHNQFLIVALGCGLPAVFSFVVWFFYPLIRLRRNREGFFLFATWLVMLVQLCIEPMLEVQFGVYVFLFFLLMQWHQMTHGVPEAETGTTTRLLFSRNT